MKNKRLDNLSCWVVSEGMAGTENQCIAVAEALGIGFDIKRVSLRQPWKSLSPFLGFEQSWSFSPALEPPWPDLVIASGRKSIAASRYIKKKSEGKTFTVQIQDPRVDPRQFDLVAVPHHDPTRGENVIVTDAAPNRANAARLEEAKQTFATFDALDAPRVAVLIGGSSKAYKMTRDSVSKLALQLARLDMRLMITTSRRTGKRNEAILYKLLLTPDREDDVYFYDGDGPNPYFGMLAWADYILVTADSASMISDACSTGKPTYIIPLEGGHPRIDRLHTHLIEKGVLKVFEGNLNAYTYEPLRDAVKIADAIKERLKL